MADLKRRRHLVKRYTLSERTAQRVLQSLHRHEFIESTEHMEVEVEDQDEQRDENRIRSFAFLHMNGSHTVITITCEKDARVGAPWQWAHATIERGGRGYRINWTPNPFPHWRFAEEYATA